ncbi:hypothetical protein NFO65_15330 [Neorhizobium galegae]|uniref:hypothetical protein n=1 Tax=Neorhizobium galegae TaxID=399 RepID=UPI002101D1EA|nr:hypothetical protein [Neorhizobium galegae]MCQ1572103.1 hypothetical protein [Neorhizobium galegae]
MNSSQKISKKKISAAAKNLADSAFDFLQKSVDEIEKHPKYAVIHFATAVELLLKARLMNEHWTLILEKPSEATQDQFFSGASKTVTPVEAVKRLKHLCGENIPAEAAAKFKDIGDHRNRMIHFFHEAGTAKAEASLVQEVVKEQCLAWFHMERLLAQWSDQFSAFGETLDNVRRQMRRNREYLKASFESLQTTIADLKKAGFEFLKCPGCGFEAGRVDALSTMLFERNCLVCNLSGSYIKMACPEGCTSIIVVDEDSVGKVKCEECGLLIGSGEVSEALDTEPYDPGEHSSAKNCAFCNTPNSVVQHNEYYLCVECISSSDGIAYCGWCNEGQIGGGNLEHSYVGGCEFCDGHAGWTSDD